MSTHHEMWKQLSDDSSIWTRKDLSYPCEKDGLVYLHCHLARDSLYNHSHDMRLRTSRVIIITRLKAILVGISYRLIVTRSRAVSENSLLICYLIFLRFVSLSISIINEWKTSNDQTYRTDLKNNDDNIDILL